MRTSICNIMRASMRITFCNIVSNRMGIRMRNIMCAAPKRSPLRESPPAQLELADTKLIGSAESLYNDLKMQMLIFKLYEGKLTDGQHVVELFSEYGKTHCGDQLVVKGILADSN